MVDVLERFSLFMDLLFWNYTRPFDWAEDPDFA
jgi:hypothetical protein